MPVAQTMIWGAPRQIKADANTEKRGEDMGFLPYWMSELRQHRSFKKTNAYILIAMSNKLPRAMRDSASAQSWGDQSWAALLTGSKTLGHSRNRSTLTARRSAWILDRQHGPANRAIPNIEKMSFDVAHVRIG